MFYLQKSTNGGKTWSNVEKFESKISADGSFGAAKARASLMHQAGGELVEYRVQPVSFAPKPALRRAVNARPDLTSSLVSRMWLNGKSIEDIDRILENNLQPTKSHEVV